MVEDKKFNVEQKQELISRIKERVGKDVKVEYQSVVSIPRGSNGKFKAVISHIKQ